MRPTLTWLATLPFAAASVLVGHAITYRVLALPRDDVHGYLAHAPQVVLVLATVALLGLAIDARSRRRSHVPVALLAAAAFVVQEHLERLIHTGHVPFLLASPALWLGVALQLPLAFVVWALTRRLASDLAHPVRRVGRRLASWDAPVAPSAPRLLSLLAPSADSARGPPVSF